MKVEQLQTENSAAGGQSGLNELLGMEVEMDSEKMVTQKLRNYAVSAKDGGFKNWAEAMLWAAECIDRKYGTDECEGCSDRDEEIDRLKDALIGGVLTYEIKSGGRACGQTIGADGSGEFAVVINGTAEVAEQWARDFLRKIEASGARLGRVVFVAAEECYAGQAVTVVTPSVTGETK